jgi:hypothetical protein
LSLITGFALAKVTGGNLYHIPRTNVAPVIDGLVDDVWKTIDATWQTSYRNGNELPTSYEDLSGWSKMLWDDTNLYGLFYVQDDVITNLATNDWERDAIEFYLDGNNAKATTFDGVDDHQFVIKHYFKDTPSAANLGHGVVYVIQDDTLTGAPSGYWVEFSVPLDSVGIPAVEGTLIGLEWQQDDNDDNLVRRIVSKWWLQVGDNSWTTPSTWGTAILDPISEAVSSAYVMNRASSAPVVDGVLDAVWDGANQVTMNQRGNGNEFPASASDQFWRFYGLYDDNNIYGFFQVWDNVVTNTATNDWERDAVEVYLDGDNSKATTFDGVNDHQFVIKHYFKDTPSAANLGHGVAYAFADVTEADTCLYPQSGYTVEFSIPLDSCGIPAVEGSPVGFELQSDDNDDGLVRKNVTKWWLVTGDNSWTTPSLWGTMMLGPALNDIKENPKQFASRFDLQQNYPNPFNPSTKISYSLKNNGAVRLSVFDIMGREVKVLVNSVQTAGQHEVTFKGDGLASGIYFYTLQTGSNVMTKKMALLK